MLQTKTGEAWPLVPTGDRVELGQGMVSNVLVAQRAEHPGEASDVLRGGSSSEVKRHVDFVFGPDRYRVLVEPDQDIDVVHALVDILGALAAHFSDIDDALGWVSGTVLPGYGGRTALDLINMGRAHRVLDYLDEFDQGLLG
ncbi:MAG: hypothetical protein AAGE03_15225 [Pseudomonadota bacterium]